MKKKLTDDGESNKAVDQLLDGFEELKLEDQEKIRKAWEEEAGELYFCFFSFPS
jgi:hypothetical protein